MLPGKTYKPEDILRLIWRGKWIILIPFVVVSLCAFAYTRQLPDLYSSSTLIMVMPPRVPDSYVRSTVSQRVEDRVQSMRTQILSRTRLEGIITDLNLYAEERKTALIEDIIEQMRREISIDTVRGDTFRVSFVARQAVVAMRVTERLAQLFIDQNLREREALAVGANDFLTTQVEDARRRLIEHEKRLEDYRRRHLGELPDQLTSNLAAITSTQVQLQSLVDALARDRDRRQTLQRMIADTTAPEAAPADPAPTVMDVDGPVPPGSAAQQLEAARRALAASALRLKPTHPDMVRMRRVVAELEQKADLEAAQRPLGTDALATSALERSRAGRVADLRAELERLEKQIVAREADEQRLKGLLNGYQARADAAPTRETELIEINRDYKSIQQLYNSLLEKSEQSKMAASLESRQIGEQFRVIDPARVAQRPFSPNRRRMNLLGAALGVGVGLALIGLIEYRDTTLRNENDVLATIALPVVGLIPAIVTAPEARRMRYRRWVLTTASGLLVVAAGAVVALLVMQA